MTTSQQTTRSPNIFENFTKEAVKDQRLKRRAAAKALDIPHDEMEINAPRTTINGFGWKEMAVIACAAAFGWHVWNQSQQPAAQPTPVTVSDTEYDVLFYDKDGKPIQIPVTMEPPK